MYHKPLNKVRDMLVHPEDPKANIKKRGVIYHLTCDQYLHHECTGEIKRTLVEWFKEHKNKDKPTAVREHCQDTSIHSPYRSPKYLHEKPSGQ